MTGNGTERVPPTSEADGSKGPVGLALSTARLSEQALPVRLLDEHDPFLVRVRAVRRSVVVVRVGDVRVALRVHVDLEEVQKVAGTRRAIRPRRADRTLVDESRGGVLLE